MLLLGYYYYFWMYLIEDHSSLGRDPARSCKEKPTRIAGVRFLLVRCPSCQPTNSVRALKGFLIMFVVGQKLYIFGF